MSIICLHRYRNPLFTAFAHKFEQHTARAKEEEARAGAGAGADEEGLGAVAREPARDRSGVRRRFLLAHTLHCNPRLAQYMSDQVSPPEVWQWPVYDTTEISYTQNLSLYNTYVRTYVRTYVYCGPQLIPATDRCRLNKSTVGQVRG